MAERDLIDPISRYPKPPFKKQPQPWPALAGKMEPPPDHCETGYKGSGRLAGYCSKVHVPSGMEPWQMSGVAMTTPLS